jgi:exopolysaccharide biosynthesis polyprenyl glycosylphosphotransferase
MISFIRRNWRGIFILIALGVDSLAIAFSAATACFLRPLFLGTPYVDLATLSSYGLYYWAVLLFFALLLGLYRGTHRINERLLYVLAGKSYLYSVLTILATLYIFQQSAFPRRFTVIFVVAVPIYFSLGRRVLGQLHVAMQRKGLGVTHSLILGKENGGGEILSRFRLFPELGYSVKGFISLDNGAARVGTIAGEDGVPRYPISELVKVLHEQHIDEILLFTPSEQNGLLELMRICEGNQTKLKVILPDSESLLRFVHVRDLTGIPLYVPLRARVQRLKEIGKRAFDIIGGCIALALFSPLLLLVALAIWLEDGPPIFHRQKRALVPGFREFEFLKFRSMVKDAESRQEALYDVNETTGGLFRLRDDPRITKVGRFIRRYSIDELPQLFSVLRGEMSLVGPRPLHVADLARIAPENSLGGYYQLRAKAKAGMTGLWQISGRREVAFREMVLLDLYYIENQSLLFDLEILFETIPVVLFGKGAY